MAMIIPAIVPTSREHLRDALEAVRFAPMVQIDIVDGMFAKPASWPYVVGDTLHDLGLVAAVDTMIDLMVVDPLVAAREWLEWGADALVIHLETVADLGPYIDLRNQYHYKLYIAGNDTLPIEHYIPWLDVVDGVQLMGIHTIGHQGEPFSEQVIHNIQALRKEQSHINILIDGAVNQETLPRLLAAGADNFAVGSAIMSAPDKRAAYQALCAMVNK